MPGDPKHCREQANRCYELAAEAQTEAAKKRFTKLASAWMLLATDLEISQSLIETSDERAAFARSHNPTSLKCAS